MLTATGPRRAETGADLAVVVRVGRFVRLGRRVLLQLLHCNGNRTLKLRVVPFRDCFGVHVHFDVGRHAVIFDLPFAFRTEEGEAG